jgi:biofilm PGA synthesis N-glycosyltransferase PgaC
VTDLIADISQQPAYLGLMIFLGVYPVVTAAYWVAGSLHFAFHREREDESFYELDHHPFVSAIVPAHNEEGVIRETVERLLALEWPAFEVMVVDDGSTDRTVEAVSSLVSAGRVRLLRKEVNEGKAMALNDALPLLRGEIVLLVDADGRPNPDVLRWMVPHFVKVPRVAAVTGNPRVANTSTVLAKLQAIEFSATVSVLRRAQATWGRLMTFSGICTALRKSAIEQVGRFNPRMATEDIALAWDLQTAFADLRYEPRAVFAMQVPDTLDAWWKQRTRWARGLGQVLRRHANVLGSWKKRRMWPVYIEAILSTLWSHLYFVAAAFWALALVVGVYGFGGNPIPNFWGLLIASMLVAQISIGLALDGRYDPAVRRYALWIPWYPLVYWMLTAAAAVRASVGGMLMNPSGPVTWDIDRKRDENAPPEHPASARGAATPATNGALDGGPAT